MTHLRDVLDVLRELQRRLPALLLLAGLDALGVAYAACDYETLRGDWLLQGSGQTAFEGEACLAAARMEVQGGGKVTFRDIQVDCPRRWIGDPQATTQSGRYLMKPGCFGQMDFFDASYFVVGDGGQQLLMTSALGFANISWTGSRVGQSASASGVTPP